MIGQKVLVPQLRRRKRRGSEHEGKKREGKEEQLEREMGIFWDIRGLVTLKEVSTSKKAIPFYGERQTE